MYTAPEISTKHWEASVLLLSAARLSARHLSITGSLPLPQEIIVPTDRSGRNAPRHRSSRWEYSCQSLSLIINFCHSEQGDLSLPHPRWLEFPFQEAVQPFRMCCVHPAWGFGGVSATNVQKISLLFPPDGSWEESLLDHGWCSTFSPLR